MVGSVPGKVPKVMLLRVSRLLPLVLVFAHMGTNSLGLRCGIDYS